MPEVKRRLTLDWGSLVPLRLRAKTVAEGVFAGAHRSPRRGAGIEFGGHRQYVPGDDLRWLDRRALMRHGKLLVREFETETDRTLRLVLDATASMGFKSPGAPGAKLAFSALVAAALARLALATGDPVGLDWFGAPDLVPLPAVGGREAHDRLLDALEAAQPCYPRAASVGDVVEAVTPIARRAPRGTIVVFLSDLVDLPAEAVERIAALGTRGRTVVVVRVLDPIEARFPFDGAVRLRSTEGDTIVEADATTARAGYLDALEEVATRWSETLVLRRGRLVKAQTTDDPVGVVRDILRAAQGRSP